VNNESLTSDKLIILDFAVKRTGSGKRPRTDQVLDREFLCSPWNVLLTIIPVLDLPPSIAKIRIHATQSAIAKLTLTVIGGRPGTRYEPNGLTNKKSYGACTPTAELEFRRGCRGYPRHWPSLLAVKSSLYVCLFHYSQNG